MKTVLFATLVGSAAAFAPQSASTTKASTTAVNGAMEDLKAIAEKSNPVLKVRAFIPQERKWYLGCQRDIGAVRVESLVHGFFRRLAWEF